MIKNATALLTFIIALLVLTSCAPTLSPHEEEQAAAATTNWLDQKFGIVNNPMFAKLSERVASRLKEGTNAVSLPSSARQIANALDFEVYLLDVPQTNAFSVGNGAIILTRGLVLSVENEAQFAAVIAHEMAHQILGHTNEALRESRDYGASPAFYFSIDKEFEADRLGLFILEQSSYETKQALHAFTIAYRNSSKGFSDVPDELKRAWLESRAANLSRLVALEKTYPSTLSTREFAMVQAAIAALPQKPIKAGT